MVAGGVVLLGFGGRMLYLNGRCADAPSPPVVECDNVFRTTSVGAGLTVTGSLLSVAGALLIAWPGPRVSVQGSSDELMRSENETGSEGAGRGLALSVLEF